MVGASIVLAGILAAADCSKPGVPLELHLELARSTITVGEELWYRLSATNTGCKPFTIHDPFWFDQNVLSRNAREKKKTLVRVFRADGSEVPLDLRWERGYHGERVPWRNECKGAPCQDGQEALELSPGQTVAASPSLPSPGFREAYVAPGARVLEGVALVEPGRYYAEAVYAPFGLDPKMDPSDIGLRRWVNETSGALLFKSPQVFFEVKPASPRPKRLRRARPSPRSDDLRKSILEMESRPEAAPVAQ